MYPPAYAGASAEQVSAVSLPGCGPVG